MGKYIIKLKPLTSYFFGGEVTFGDGSNQNYLVKSNVLPQASALLGLVRYEVLRCNGLLSYGSDKKSEVDKLIGKNGFNLESPAEAYGAIKSISPIFITDGTIYYTPMPMDFYHNVSFNSQNRCCYSQDTPKSTPIIDKFSWKTFETYKYWVGNNDKKVVEFDDIFQFIDQVGITKNNANDNKEKAFFKYYDLWSRYLYFKGTCFPTYAALYLSAFNRAVRYGGYTDADRKSHHSACRSRYRGRTLPLRA